MAEGPRPGGHDPLTGIDDEKLVKIPLVQNDQHIAEDKRRGVGDVAALHEGGEAHAQHGPEDPGEEEQPADGEDLPQPGCRLCPRSPRLFQRRKAQRRQAVGQQHAQNRRQPAGHRAARDPPRDICPVRAAADAVAGKLALNVVHIGGGEGQRAEDGHEKNHGVGIEGAVYDAAVKAGIQRLLLCQLPQNDVRGGKEHCEGYSDHAQHKANGAHRLLCAG